MLPWVQDGISKADRETIGALLNLRELSTMQTTVRLPWLQDAISEVEHEIIYSLRILGTSMLPYQLSRWVSPEWMILG